MNMFSKSNTYGFLCGSLLAFFLASTSVTQAAPQGSLPSGEEVQAAASQKAKTFVAAKSKKRAAAKTPAPFKSFTLTNGRGSALLQLSITDEQGKQLIKLKKPLQANGVLVSKTPKNKTCVFDIRAVFEDGAEFEETAYNLCEDTTIRFTD